MARKQTKAPSASYSSVYANIVRTPLLVAHIVVTRKRNGYRIDATGGEHVRSDAQTIALGNASKRGQLVAWFDNEKTRQAAQTRAAQLVEQLRALQPA